MELSVQFSSLHIGGGTKYAPPFTFSWEYSNRSAGEALAETTGLSLHLLARTIPLFRAEKRLSWRMACLSAGEGGKSVELKTNRRPES
jgi:hypothetical protein